MKKSKIYLLVIVLLVLNIFQLITYFKQKEKIEKLTPSDEVVMDEKDNSCEVEEIVYGISGTSMEPLIKNLDKVKVEKNYYNCNKRVDRGDIIIYESSSTDGEIIKQIKALPGDKIKFDNSKMFINGEVLKNSVGTEYTFKDDEISFMALYTPNSILQDGSYFAFGDNTTESIDSRKMGGIGINNFKGKVILE